jgi:small subunit ribosomal protein S14
VLPQLILAAACGSVVSKASFPSTAGNVNPVARFDCTQDHQSDAKVATTKAREPETAGAADANPGCKLPVYRYLPRSFMAKTSWINRNERKRATVKKYAAARADLKAKKDYAGLSQLPRDASPTRVVNRCEVTGRRRAFIRRFKVSRLTFRELASSGLIPGVTKSSW